MRIKKPNILLIMADQLAAPALPIYGHKQVIAPNIDKLAKNSVIFDKKQRKWADSRPERCFCGD